MAGYAILKGKLDSTAPGPISIEIVRLPYSINASIERAWAVDMPALTEYVFELRTANHRSQMQRRLK
jgi:protein phosphatase